MSRMTTAALKFKPHQPGKLSISRNTSHSCAYCFATKKPGEDPFPVCAGCKAVRYCNREHQKADWKAHKTFCQNQKNASEILARIEAPGSSGLSPVQEIQQRLQDWSGVHLYSIHEAIVSAVQLAGPQFNIEKGYIRIRVGERTNNDGNPATAFFIKNVMLSTDPESMKITARDADMHHVYPDNFIRAEIQRMRPYLKDTMARRAGSMRQGEEFIGYINVITEGIPLFPIAQSIPAYRWNEPDVEWCLTLKQAVDTGLVYRKVDEPRGSFWAPGKMVKKKTNWVWVQRET